MSDQLFDHAVRDWLEDGSDRTPPTAIDAVLLAVKTTPQERDLRIPRRFTQLPTYTRLAAGIAIVAVLGVGAYTFLGRSSNIGGPGATASPSLATASPSLAPTASPSPSPSPSPSIDPLDTSAWTPYVSSRFGFSIAHPYGWTEYPATHDWMMPADVDWLTTGAEAFSTSDGGGVRMSAWSLATEPGTTVDAWLQAYCPLTIENTADPVEQCPTFLGKAVPATMDGHAGLLVAFPTDTQAFFLVEDRLYVVVVWRPETEPSVARFSGTRKLLETAISTMHLLAGGPATTSSPPPN